MKQKSKYPMASYQLCFFSLVTILFFNLMTSISKSQIIYNKNINLINGPVYFPVEPPKKIYVQANHSFNPSKIKMDWVPIENMVIDSSRIEEEYKIEKAIMTSQPNKTKFSAWDAGPMLHKYLNAFLITKEKIYLTKFLEHYDYFYSVRMDQQGRIDFNGLSLPQWERLDRFNIFTVSPYFSYSINDKDTIMSERGWKSLYFSDINYSGLFLDPILRFVQIVHHSKITSLQEKADKILQDALKVINSHNPDWVELETNKVTGNALSSSHDQTEMVGFYKFPYNSPFFLDNVEMPINEAFIFGSALVRAYMLTNSEFYFQRASAMFNRLKAYIAKDNFGYITYPYFTGKPFDGWVNRDEVSKNTPTFLGEKYHENFHKTALTIDFLILLDQARPGTTTEYLREFYWVILASMKTNTLTAQFPGELGFGHPYNNYHAVLPYNSKGWLHLATQDIEFTNNTLNHITFQKKETLSDLLYFQLLTETNLEDYQKQIISEEVSPLYLDDEIDHNTNCLWSPPITGMVKISFVHHSPKHNRIYLYNPANDKMKIRMETEKGGGVFYSTIYVNKDSCIDLRWERSLHGAPSTPEENRIKFSYTRANSLH